MKTTMHDPDTKRAPIPGYDAEEPSAHGMPYDDERESAEGMSYDDDGSTEAKER